MAEYLYLFTIGPVQDFIAAARRTRDLWAGSQLLSELSRIAAKTLCDDYPAQLIFPAPDEKDKELSDHDVVNRILASVMTEEPEQVGEAVKKKVHERLQELCKETFDDKKRIEWPQDSAKNHRSNAEKQVDDLIEIYWATAQSTGNYKQDRENLEAALAARKNTRDFVQPTAWADYVPKSSIDGLRESVIDEQEYAPPGSNVEQRREASERLFRRYGTKGVERLSGVDLLKRHYWPHNSFADFPSTSHFAALPYLQNIRKTFGEEKLLTAFSQYRKGLEGLVARGSMVRLEKLAEHYQKYLPHIEGYDTSILFESRLAEEIDVKDEATHTTALGLLQDFFKIATNGARPEPYYALLHGDGDFMGKTIDKLAEQQDDGTNRHRAFSRKLDMFASGVRKIVEEHHLGALVYSGGDDVLAFLPLHTVVQCAKTLADDFATKMGNFDINPKPSLSIGIAICHHLEPLSDALNLAREAEKIAKKIDGKNALAITLSKRGGGDRTISGSWAGNFYQRLLNLTEWHRSGAIPDNAAYNLHDLIERLGEAFPTDALKAEAVRIVKRKRGQQGQAEKANEQLVKLAETLYETEKEWGVLQFANELIVTREFAKAEGYEDNTQSKGATP